MTTKSVNIELFHTIPNRADSYESIKTGLSLNLGWIHYRALMRIDREEARQFYTVEAEKNCWSGRELERQINSLLYDRLAKSKDKEGLINLAKEESRN
ncbi:DUF1016 N-terminal domain-containing protein [Legionella bozemanae]|nr:DUF1016 N-terminal domain-containing protein [Legionella bozemanae]